MKGAAQYTSRRLPRVLHLLKTAVGATWALRQTRELVRAGIEVHVALPDGPLVARYRAVGCHAHVVQPAISRGAVRDELGLRPDRAIVGMVAYLYAPKRYLGQRTGLKGHEDLIEALARVRTRGRDVVGVFVGGAWDGAVAYEQRVRDLAARRL